jgi:hypothetical protein
MTIERPEPLYDKGDQVKYWYKTREVLELYWDFKAQSWSYILSADAESNPIANELVLKLAQGSERVR